jgi:hypothetical protein
MPLLLLLLLPLLPMLMMVVWRLAVKEEVGGTKER